MFSLLLLVATDHLYCLLLDCILNIVVCQFCCSADCLRKINVLGLINMKINFIIVPVNCFVIEQKELFCAAESILLTNQDNIFYRRCNF